MAKKLRVYGWIGWRNECPPAPNGSRQTREIMAARSVAEIIRATGIRRSDYNHAGDETGNPDEIAVAMAKPHTVFWHPLDERRNPNWREGESSGVGDAAADE